MGKFRTRWWKGERTEREERTRIEGPKEMELYNEGEKGGSEQGEGGNTVRGSATPGIDSGTSERRVTSGTRKES